MEFLNKFSGTRVITTANVITLCLVIFILIQGWVIRKQDAKFDSLQQKQEEQVRVSEAEATKHLERANQLQDEIAALGTLMEGLRVKDQQISANIVQIERNKNVQEQLLKNALNNADKPIDILARCQRICDTAKQLGLLDPAAECQCK